MLNLSKMKVEKLKIRRETLVTLKRMKINTVEDLASVSDNFLQDVGKLLCDIHECNQASVMFDIVTLMESIQNDTIGLVYDENLQVGFSEGIDFEYPKSICNSLSAFDDFVESKFDGDVLSAMKYVQDIVEGRKHNGILSATEITLLKLRYKYLYRFHDIDDMFELGVTKVCIIIEKALHKLNTYLENLSTDEIEKLQLTTRD